MEGIKMKKIFTTIIMLVAIGLVIYGMKKHFISSYVVCRENFRENGQTIYYPSISDMKDKELEKKINGIISQIATSSDGFGDADFQLEIDYEVTYTTEDVLSIVFYETQYIRSTDRMFNRCYAITINMQTGETIHIYDYLTKKALQEKFLNKSFALKKGVNDVEDLTREWLLCAYLQGTDNPEIISIYEDEVEHINDFYLREGVVGIIVPVPDIGGGYALFELE